MESKKLSRYATYFLIIAFGSILSTWITDINSSVVTMGALVCGTVNHVGSLIMKELEKNG
ncbi:hypothetical protein [Shewanella chilikensis]|uniref:hypothetical protein n=1 Tax=Shewanella chilikensis TaxID=558541 RepID=UPI003A982E8A